MQPEDIAPFARSPIIFCRNAFIYFSPQAIKRVVGNFAALMPHPVSVRRRLGIAVERDHRVLARGDRRRVRLREARP
jgi:hypothetical protein